jgi:hypothetical protein
MEKKPKKQKRETWLSDPAMDPAYAGVVQFEYGKLIHRQGCFQKRKLPACE